MNRTALDHYILSLMQVDARIIDIEECLLTFTCWYNHRELGLNAKVNRRVIGANAHFVSEVLIVKLRVHPHEYRHTLVHLALLLLFENHVLGEQHHVLVQVVSHFLRVERLEEDLYHVTEAHHKNVELVDCLGGEGVGGALIATKTNCCI
jgi:hypothetical protein